jgi:hypothetical protein
MTSTSVFAVKLDSNGKFNKEDLYQVFRTIPDDIVAWLYPERDRGRVFRNIWDDPEYMKRLDDANDANPKCPLNEKNILKPEVQIGAGGAPGAAGANPLHAEEYVTKSMRAIDGRNSAPQWVDLGLRYTTPGTGGVNIPITSANGTPGNLRPNDLSRVAGDVDGAANSGVQVTGLVDLGGGGRNDAVKVRQPFKKKRGRKTIKKNT